MTSMPDKSEQWGEVVRVPGDTCCPRGFTVVRLIGTSPVKLVTLALGISRLTWISRDGSISVPIDDAIHLREVGRS